MGVLLVLGVAPVGVGKSGSETMVSGSARVATVGWGVGLPAGALWALFAATGDGVGVAFT